MNFYLLIDFNLFEKLEKKAWLNQDLNPRPLDYCSGVAVSAVPPGSAVPPSKGDIAARRENGLVGLPGWDVPHD